MLDGEVGNSATTPHALTQRQQSVMERIDRRMPIKVIAQDLGLSETRINQHIRALKDIYGAENLSELVENHRIAVGRSPGDDDGRSELTYTPDRTTADGSVAEPSSGATVIRKTEPWAVPTIFNGPNGTLMRLGAIVALAIGIVLVVSLMAAASMALSTVLDARPEVAERDLAKPT